MSLNNNVIDVVCGR